MFEIALKYSADFFSFGAIYFGVGGVWALGGAGGIATTADAGDDSVFAVFTR